MGLPKILTDQIREGNTLLFLGAGASFGAKNASNKTIPTGNELAKSLAEKYLGKEYSNLSLIKAAELSIVQTDLFTVQDYIADLFTGFQPAEFHKLIPKFVWQAIATTNYDLIIERAYDLTTDRLQTLVPFLKNSDRVEEKLKNPASVQYVKLHGCITATHDKQIPLILTTEQYNTHRKNRNFLFERFSQLASNFGSVSF
jgi:hypothetical protein